MMGSLPFLVEKMDYSCSSLSGCSNERGRGLILKVPRSLIVN